MPQTAAEKEDFLVNWYLFKANLFIFKNLLENQGRGERKGERDSPTVN